ncbi:hypothetical protein [Falsiphaeobacter marinintestinus]|uniref:hypothetical protein n=1 Tax=Falsiphaeobacter marinintestinus TaxID=1492905 RepID=UPI0011B78F8F|nr:hypothetical protein [Phaeobacter marinintestinus]
MDISRSKAVTPRLSALSVDLDQLQGPCVGCADCVGLCEALLEALFVPDVVLSRKRGKFQRYENSNI